MNLRTPRRRISPRTKRRYRAIKNFLQRALGSSSQPNINTNSSFVSFSDLKQKIVGIEHQLNTVSKHCQDLASLEYKLRPNTISTVTTKVEDDVNSDKGTHTISVEKPETKVLYKTSQRNYQIPRLISKETINDDDLKTKSKSEMIHESNACYKEKRRNKYDRLEPIQEGIQTLRKHRHHSVIENDNTADHTTNYNSFHDGISVHQHVRNSETHHHKKKNKKTYELNYCFTTENNPHLFQEKWRNQKNKNLRNKYNRPELDEDFISDIIRRQYRPVKLLGRRESDFSQFSAPVCRDQEFSIHDTVRKGSELCSCCHKEHRRQKHTRYMCCNDLSDMRSICDTRLYSSRKQKSQITQRKRLEDYNDSAMYDIVPVKEKSSPKSRRKFVEDNVLASNMYKEIPPSPRTHRPRLNLQTHFNTEEYENVLRVEKQRRRSAKPKSPIQNYSNNSIISSEVFIHNRNGKGVRKSQDANTTEYYFQEGLQTIGSPQHPVVANEIVNIDTTLNTQSTGITEEKTDKTLSEIKDILQSFLLEIKKESSQNDKLNTPSSNGQKNLDTHHLDNKSTAPNFGYGFNNNNSFGQCVPPFIQSFTNPCCYPILPICPMNCIQNGFVAPSPSCSCAACANNSKDRTCDGNHSKNKTNASETAGTETQKLIKEIHKLISQNPNSVQKEDSFNVNNSTALKNCTKTKVLMSRSVGGSSKTSKHDAKVGTKMKCCSKSCEAIGSRLVTGCAANMSYSDTILEKGSSEEVTNAQSSSESEYSSESTVADKKKENKFSKMLKSMGLLRKNKLNAIEKLSESVSTIENGRPQDIPPFQQHILSYNMHGQEYSQPPSMPIYPTHQHQYEYCNNSVYPTTCYSPPCLHDKTKNCHGRCSPEHAIRSHCTSPQHTPVPRYPNYYDPYGNVPPQVPLCLKEIEVKSIGTQSVRKMSLLQKFTNKMQVPATKMKESQQTENSTVTTKDKVEKNIFDWKKWQAKTEHKTNTDPLKFSYKTQKRLAEGDIKMRNAMLKKLFYKRNPFSPRNLLVRTLLGKDKSSFGEPPKMYKPRMFL